MKKPPRSFKTFPNYSNETWRDLRRDRTKRREAVAWYVDRLGPLNILQGLRAAQRVEFIALVGQLHASFRGHRTGHWTDLQLALILSRYRSTSNKMRNKLKDVCEALEALDVYVGRHQDSLMGDYLRNLCGLCSSASTSIPMAEQIRGDRVRYSAMSVSDPKRVDKEVREILAETSRSLTRPQAVRNATVKLADWLRTALGSRNEAEIRSQRISNVLFGEAGPIQERSDVLKPRGAQTVRSRSRRDRRGKMDMVNPIRKSSK